MCEYKLLKDFLVVHTGYKGKCDHCRKKIHNSLPRSVCQIKSCLKIHRGYLAQIDKKVYNRHVGL